jgi:hypothetical protein
MADFPISGLSTLTTYSTSDLLEILDVTDTTFASTGTNKKVTFQNLLNMAPFLASGASHIGGSVPDPGATAGTTRFLREDSTWVAPIGVTSGGTGLATLTPHAVILGEGTANPGFATTGTAGRVLTDNGSGVDPTFQPSVTNFYQYNALGSNYPITTGWASTGLSISIPYAGSYFLFAVGTAGYTISGGLNAGINVSVRLYDVTNSVTVPNSQILLSYAALQAATGTGVTFYNSSAIGGVVYQLSAAATIQLQAIYSTSGTVSGQVISAGAVLTAIRIA